MMCRRGDAESIQQFVRLAAAWNFPDREPVDGVAGAGHGFGHCVADAAGGVMIFDRDEVPTRRARGGDEPILVHRSDRVQIDHPDCGACRLESVVRLERFEHRDAGADDGRHVVSALAQHLQAANRKRSRRCRT